MIHFQTCAYCKRKGANMGCWNQSCRRSYHLHCAFDNECVYEFVEPYKSFCHQHYATNTVNTSHIHNESEKCGICQSDMLKFSAVNSIQTICCNDGAWYHKKCLKSTAFAFSTEFECPSCQNRDEFRKNMAMNGIYIPKDNYLPNYCSQLNGEKDVDEEEEIVQQPKRRRVHKNWIFDRTFANKKEAIEAIDAEECWAYYYMNRSLAGERVNYRCDAMKYRGKQCDAGIYLLYDSKNSSVHLYRCELPHSHENEECKKNARNIIPAETENAIRELFNQNVKPKAILYNLVLKGFQPPSKSRLTTLLTKLRKGKYGDEKLNFATLQKWCLESSAVPDSDCEPFVVNHEMLIDDTNEDKNELRFLVSSKRLIQNAINADIFQTDATYKLIWQNFPVLVFGFNDKNRRFHPTGVCVTSHERSADFEFFFRSLKTAVTEIFNAQLKPSTLIADAADSIKNGFVEVFGDKKKLVMCWAHVRRNVSKNLSKYIRDKKKQAALMFDLDQLQLSRSPEILEKASQLFVKKWEKESIEFVDYFTKEWLQQHRNWYEGYAKDTPSTNNALEATNRVIKDEQTFRERLDLSQFRFVLYNMVRQWSIEYEQGLNTINLSKPDIELKWWTAGYQFARSNKKIISAKRGSQITYTIPTTDEQNCVENLSDWKLFSDYRSSLDIVHTTFKSPVTSENWQKGSCDCGDFFKNYVCEHLIGVALRLKCVQAPAETKTVPIGQKRKRGRPAKSRPALEMQ